MATYGDIIRNMDDEEIAEFLVETLNCNESTESVYRINLNGKIIIAVDEDDLAERLGEECEDD